MADFGNKKGNICYVGIFGVDAKIVGCPYQNICKVIWKEKQINWMSASFKSFIYTKYDSSTKTGACIYSNLCVTTGAIKCFNTDLGNKQGPLCYVGQFNGAKMINCASGQYCAVIKHIQSI